MQAAADGQPGLPGPPQAGVPGKLFIAVNGHHILKGSLNEKSVVVDLGANVGNFSREISQTFGCRVLAVEADPEVYERSYESALVQKLHCAIADFDGTIDLYLSSNPEANSIMVQHSHIDAGRHVQVPAVRLDKLLADHGIQEIDLLKVDIEGAEISVLDSIPPGRYQCIRQINVEFHDFIEALHIGDDVRRIKEQLKELGFTCVVCTRPNKDVLFINQRYFRINPLVLSLNRAYIRLVGWYHVWLKPLFSKERPKLKGA